MPKTKKQLVEEILSIEEVDSKTNLLKKSNTELENILFSLKTMPKSEEKAVELDVEAIKEQLKADMLAELKEQARLEVEKETVVEVKTETVVPIRKKDIDRFEPIPVMNITLYSLVYNSKRSGSEWLWSEYGDIEYMEFQELLTMRSSQRRFIDEPFILILDEDVIDYMGLTKTYESFDKDQLQSLENVFRLPQTEYEEMINSLPKGIQHSVILKARELFSLGKLDSLKKINFLNERFSTDIGQRG